MGKDNSNQKLSYSELLKKAQKYCISQEKTVFQVTCKLKNWGASKETIEKVIQSLKKDDFINEERFVSLFIKSKIKYNKWGKNKIIAALRFYKIEEDFIANFDEFINLEFYIKVLENLIEKKAKELTKEKDEALKKQKIISYCKSKGFETNIIFNILEKK